MWILKIILKIIFARLPISKKFWKKVGVFRNGGMNKEEYSKKIFFGHLEELRDIRTIDKPIIMEIGPGDGLATAIYSSLYNSPKVYLIDNKRCADTDISAYKTIIRSLSWELFNKEELNKIKNINEFLKIFNTYYLTDGLQSLKKINTNSVDYLFSHSVMEHIRLHEIDEYILEMKRILKPNGLISHNINYKDHLQESLNNLRFPTKIWESEFFAKSGFYTNRIPAVEMHDKFSKAGFKLIKENFGKWEKLPLKRKFINKEFKNFSNDQLMNSTSSFIAKIS